MCVLSIKVSIRKKSGNLFNDPHIYNQSNPCRKIAAGNIEQVMEAAPNKVAAVRLPSTHHENYQS